MLVRMEGKLDLTSQRLSDVVPRVERHETAITDIMLAVQGLADQAKSRDAANAAAWKARDDTVEATARALAEAKVTQEATAAAETVKADKSWSSVSKLIATISIVVAVVSALWALFASLPNV
jgi:hypothetical protein